MEDKDLNKLSAVISAYKIADGTRVAVYDKSLNGFYSEWGVIKGVWIDTTYTGNCGFIVQFPTKGLVSNTVGIERIFTYGQLAAHRRTVDDAIYAMTELNLIVDARDKILASLRTIEALLIKYEQMEEADQSE